MRTRARRDGDAWVLNGAKCWITNGGKSTWYTVMAVTDPTKAPTASRRSWSTRTTKVSASGQGTKAGDQGLPHHRTVFRELPHPGRPDHRRPRHRLQDRAGDAGSHPPTIGAQAVGIAQGALDAAVAYTKERKQFGKSISDFQGVQFMLADMAMKVEAARLMVYHAAARAERGETSLGFISAASKCFASDVAMEVTTDAVQLFGGAGYTVDFPVERMMRDAKITQIYEGTNQIQRVVMARALLAMNGPSPPPIRCRSWITSCADRLRTQGTARRDPGAPTASGRCVPRCDAAGSALCSDGNKAAQPLLRWTHRCRATC